MTLQPRLQVRTCETRQCPLTSEKKKKKVHMEPCASPQLDTESRKHGLAFTVTANYVTEGKREKAERSVKKILN